ncbi:MAG: hypothetical protein II833_06630, partial [Pseudobutyrivibrio sp.]|nr:hypothetical protein [Pseudobutyrivibrio sp.]
QKYKIPFDNKSTEIEEKASELQSKFGQYGNFTQPSFRRARDVCNEFCGDGKFLDQIVKNFEEFDQESCTYVDRSGIEQFVDEYTDDVGRTAKALDEAEVYDPHINDVFVDIVSMGAAVGINQLNNSLLKEDALNEFYESLRNSPLYTEAIMRRYKTAERIIKMSVPFSQEYIDTWLLNEDNKLAYLVVKQKLNPETDQGIMSFLESIDNRNKAIKWLDPNYKMTDAEVKKAKEIAEAELAKMEKSVATYEYQNIYNERYSVNYDEKLRELSEKEKIEYANYEIFRLLEDKTNPALSFMRGVKGYGIPIKKFFDGVDAEISGTLREMTGAQTLSDTYQGIEDVDKKYERLALDRQNAMTQHLVATTTANAIIDTALYFATSGMLQAYGLTEGMSATAAFATNQYAQFVQDATISYMPYYLEYASDGVITDSEKRAFLNEIAVGGLANLTLGTLDAVLKTKPWSSLQKVKDEVSGPLGDAASVITKTSDGESQVVNSLADDALGTSEKTVRIVEAEKTAEISKVTDAEKIVEAKSGKIDKKRAEMVPGVEKIVPPKQINGGTYDVIVPEARFIGSNPVENAHNITVKVIDKDGDVIKVWREVSGNATESERL